MEVENSGSKSRSREVDTMSDLLGSQSDDDHVSKDDEDEEEEEELEEEPIEKEEHLSKKSENKVKMPIKSVVLKPSSEMKVKRKMLDEKKIVPVAISSRKKSLNNDEKLKQNNKKRRI